MDVVQNASSYKINTSKVTDNIAKRYGHEVLRLSPYSYDLKAIELIWADEKTLLPVKIKK